MKIIDLSTDPKYKGYVVTTNIVGEHDQMMDAIGRSGLIWNVDYILAGSSIYFARAADRTLFLLSLSLVPV